MRKDDSKRGVLQNCRTEELTKTDDGRWVFWLTRIVQPDTPLRNEDSPFVRFDRCRQQLQLAFQDVHMADVPIFDNSNAEIQPKQPQYFPKHRFARPDAASSKARLTVSWTA